MREVATILFTLTAAIGATLGVGLLGSLGPIRAKAADALRSG